MTLGEILHAITDAVPLSDSDRQTLHNKIDSLSGNENAEGSETEEATPEGNEQGTTDQAESATADSGGSTSLPEGTVDNSIPPSMGIVPDPEPTPEASTEPPVVSPGLGITETESAAPEPGTPSVDQPQEVEVGTVNPVTEQAESNPTEAPSGESESGSGAS